MYRHRTDKLFAWACIVACSLLKVIWKRWKSLIRTTERDCSIIMWHLANFRYTKCGVYCVVRRILNYIRSFLISWRLQRASERIDVMEEQLLDKWRTCVDTSRTCSSTHYCYTQLQARRWSAVGRTLAAETRNRGDCRGVAAGGAGRCLCCAKAHVLSYRFISRPLTPLPTSPRSQWYAVQSINQLPSRTVPFVIRRIIVCGSGW